MEKWLVYFICVQIVHFIATWKLYSKAAEKPWKALIPIYNAFVLMRIINRPKWWVLLLFIPVINLIVFPIIWIETIRSFGKNSTKDTWFVLFSFGFYVAYVNYFSKELIHIKNRNLTPKTEVGEWVGSISFAIIAATLVHTYIMQPYTIPSSSLEKTLLVGDFLFVSKFHYGARIPMTTISAPMVHDTLPVFNTKSYVFDDRISEQKKSWLSKFQLPYLRLPGFQKIKRNSIVVFNQPADTLLDMNDFHPDRNYYKPIDKKTNLVKRCVAIAGDSLEIKNGYIYINGKKTILPERAKPQYNFFVNTGGQRISQTFLENRYGAREGLKYGNGNFAITKSGGYKLTLTDKEAKRIANNPAVKKVTKLMEPKGVDGDVFPHDASLGWNIDNYGPIYIPQKGKRVAINKKSLPFYKRIIQEYEQNDLEINQDVIFINGIETNQYTFKQDYYWMMGDNRQNSLDARSWGYVPFDHVVGKPVLIWLSLDANAKGLNKIRWKRLFTTVGGAGEPTSYFVPVLILLGLLFGYNQIKKRKISNSKK